MAWCATPSSTTASPTLGVTLPGSRPPGPGPRSEADGIGDRAEVRHGDYREVTEHGFDAISSIGLTEHIGVANYPAYFRFLRERLRDEGRLLNHCITRPDNQHVRPPARRGSSTATSSPTAS